MDSVNQTFWGKLQAYLESIPDQLWTAVFILLSLLGIILLIGIVWRILRGDELETKWFKLGGGAERQKLATTLEQEKASHSQKVKDIATEYQTALEDVRRELGAALEKTKREHSYISRINDDKQVVIEITKDFLGDFVAVLDGTWEADVGQFVTRQYNLVLHMLKSVVHSPVNESNPHRIGLFLPDPSDPSVLRLLDSCTSGFSGTQIQTKRLSIRETAAGYVFHTGRIYRNPHLSERNDGIFRLRGDKRCSYESLVCVPVKVGATVRGVLSMDARLPNSFTDEDILHLEYAAALISLGLTLLDIEQERDEPEAVSVAGEGDK